MGRGWNGQVVDAVSEWSSTDPDHARWHRNLTNRLSGPSHPGMFAVCSALNKEVRSAACSGALSIHKGIYV